MFDLQGREDADALAFLVTVKGDARESAEDAFVVFRLKAEVVFDKDLDGRLLPIDVVSNALNVVDEEEVLLVGVLASAEFVEADYLGTVGAV